MRRAAVSIVSNVAEGAAKNTRREFTSHKVGQGNSSIIRDKCFPLTAYYW
ncbi:MAG: four helix bundle protein [Deltaproteobacteria bacterium]|nr:MAG: four helix bundle protein [Deltaproteobacteria bacterium]